MVGFSSSTVVLSMNPFERILDLNRLTGEIGMSDRTRTCNLRFWRPLLFQLSYRHRIGRAGFAPSGGLRPSLKKSDCELTHVIETTCPMRFPVSWRLSDSDHEFIGFTVK